MSKPSQPIIQNVISALMELKLTIIDLDFRYHQEYEKNKEGEWVFHVYHTYLDIVVEGLQSSMGSLDFGDIIGIHPITGNTVKSRLIEATFEMSDDEFRQTNLSFRIY